MSIETPRRRGNYADLWRDIVLDLVEETGLKNQLNEAKCVADLGSGSGLSTLVLHELSPEAAIHTVDALIDTPRIEESKSVKHHKQLIHDFLRRSKFKEEPLDIVYISSVPEHQLDKEGGYGLLRSALSDKGIVIEAGDTALDVEEMQKRFHLLGEIPIRGKMSNRIWKAS